MTNSTQTLYANAFTFATLKTSGKLIAGYIEDNQFVWRSSSNRVFFLPLNHLNLVQEY